MRRRAWRALVLAPALVVVVVASLLGVVPGGGAAGADEGCSPSGGGPVVQWTAPGAVGSTGCADLAWSSGTTVHVIAGTDIGRVVFTDALGDPVCTRAGLLDLRSSCDLVGTPPFRATWTSTSDADHATVHIAVIDHDSTADCPRIPLSPWGRVAATTVHVPPGQLVACASLPAGRERRLGLWTDTVSSTQGEGSVTVLTSPGAGSCQQVARRGVGDCTVPAMPGGRVLVVVEAPGTDGLEEALVARDQADPTGCTPRVPHLGDAPLVVDLGAWGDARCWEIPSPGNDSTLATSLDPSLTTRIVSDGYADCERADRRCVVTGSPRHEMVVVDGAPDSSGRVLVWPVFRGDALEPGCTRQPAPGADLATALAFTADHPVACLAVRGRSNAPWSVSVAGAGTQVDVVPVAQDVDAGWCTPDASSPPAATCSDLSSVSGRGGVFHADQRALLLLVRPPGASPATADVRLTCLESDCGPRFLINTERPSWRGRAQVGHQLVARPGTWAPAGYPDWPIGVMVEYVWRIDGRRVHPYDERTFTVEPWMAGHRLQVVAHVGTWDTGRGHAGSATVVVAPRS